MLCLILFTAALVLAAEMLSPCVCSTVECGSRVAGLAASLTLPYGEPEFQNNLSPALEAQRLSPAGLQQGGYCVVSDLGPVVRR